MHGIEPLQCWVCIAPRYIPNTVVDRTALHHDGYTAVDEAGVAAVDVDFT